MEGYFGGLSGPKKEIDRNERVRKIKRIGLVIIN
jgi:hypothetical protein